MVVKSVRGRRRYIAFTVDPSLNREMLISRLRSVSGDAAPYVVQCAEGWCILRVSPKDSESALSLMSRLYPDSKSVSTSGTLRTLRSRYPVLKSTKPPFRR